MKEERSGLDRGWPPSQPLVAAGPRFPIGYNPSSVNLLTNKQKLAEDGRLEHQNSSN